MDVESHQQLTYWNVGAHTVARERLDLDGLATHFYTLYRPECVCVCVCVCVCACVCVCVCVCVCCFVLLTAWGREGRRKKGREWGKEVGREGMSDRGRMGENLQIAWKLQATSCIEHVCAHLENFAMILSHVLIKQNLTNFKFLNWFNS